MKYPVHEYGYVLTGQEMDTLMEKMREAGIPVLDGKDAVDRLDGFWLDDFTGGIKRIFKDTEEDYTVRPYEDDPIAVLPLPEYPNFWRTTYWDVTDMIQDFRRQCDTPVSWLPEDDEPIRRNLYEITGITN